MKNRIVVSREVNVPELYFKNEGRLKTFPRRMELDGREYTFMDGLRYVVHRHIPTCDLRSSSASRIVPSNPFRTNGSHGYRSFTVRSGGTPLNHREEPKARKCSCRGGHIQKGQNLIQVFDMTDGARDYRLQFDDSQHSWTLVDMTI